MVYRGVEIGIRDDWTDWSATDRPLCRPDDRLQAMIQIADKQAPLFVPAEAEDFADLPEMLGDARNERLEVLLSEAGLDPGKTIEQIVYQILEMRGRALSSPHL